MVARESWILGVLMLEGRRSGGSVSPEKQGSVQPQHTAQETAKCAFPGISGSENREVKAWAGEAREVSLETVQHSEEMKS